MIRSYKKYSTANIWLILGKVLCGLYIVGGLIYGIILSSYGSYYTPIAMGVMAASAVVGLLSYLLCRTVSEHLTIMQRINDQNGAIIQLLANNAQTPSAPVQPAAPSASSVISDIEANLPNL